MNFFEAQDHAQRKTGHLVAMFVGALLATIAGVYVLIRGVFFVWGGGDLSPIGLQYFSWWHPNTFLWSLLSTVVIVGGGTWWKIAQLARGGGSLVAEELGGTFVDFRTSDPQEQQFINVVEEMSIASGVSVPLLYVLENEPGINAFAAGFSTNQAAIAVSRGCLDLLNRDELQGVIAHEFSHILNGDMRLNIRMIGVLHGILMIAIAGSFIFRMALGSGRSSRRSKSDGGVVPLLALGAGLYIVGLAGRFFGRIIQSAVSRQREYLADAAAVQFTRNPRGIAGALKKIGGSVDGASIDNPNAEECSHMFFGDALKRGWLNRAFATHPPLKERIRRIEPHFTGAFPPVERVDKAQLRLAEVRASAERSLAAASGFAASAAASADNVYHIDPDQVLGKVGSTSSQQVDHARQLLDAIPDELRADTRDPYSAASLVFALVIGSDSAAHAEQFGILKRKLTDRLALETKRRVDQLDALGHEHRLPLVELLIPALRRMSAAQARQFNEILDALVEADGEVTLFEFCLKKLISHRLEAPQSQARPRYHGLTPIREEVTTLMSILAQVGADDTLQAEQVFRDAMRGLEEQPWTLDVAMVSALPDFSNLSNALDCLVEASPGVKGRLVGAMAHLVLADNEVTLEEAELLRAICEVIDIPLPPFLPTL